MISSHLPADVLKAPGTPSRPDAGRGVPGVTSRKKSSYAGPYLAGRLLRHQPARRRRRYVKACLLRDDRLRRRRPVRETESESRRHHRALAR